MLHANELRRREVVDSLTAERLGFVSDIEIDFQTGLIQAIIVPQKQYVLGIFKRKREYVIPWENIAALGSDIILVNMESSFLYPQDSVKNESINLFEKFKR